MPNRSDYLIAALTAVCLFWVLYFLSGGRLDYNPDGANALHVAQNFLDGEGFVEKRAYALTSEQRPSADITKPILLPFLIVVLAALGFEPTTAGTLVTLLSFSVAAGSIYLMSRLALPRTVSLIVLALFCIFVHGLKWALVIHEEWLFLSLSFLTLFLLAKLREEDLRPAYSQWFLLGTLSAATLLASYQGLPLVVTVTAVILFDAIKRRDYHRQVTAFFVGIFITAIVPFLRFVYHYAKDVRPGFIGSGDSTVYRIASDFVHVLQLDYLGALIFWTGDGSAIDVFIVFVVFASLGLLSWIHRRQKAVLLLCIYVGVYLGILVIRAGLTGVPFLEPRRVLPISALLILILAATFFELWRSKQQSTKRVAGLISLIATLVFVHGQLLKLDEISERWDSDRPRGFCPSPETMRWMKEHIPMDSVVISTQCGYQMFAEANEYYWLRIPPADQYSTSPEYLERWTEDDLLRVSRVTESDWVVIFRGTGGLLGTDGDRLIEKPGYGPFITSLINDSYHNDSLEKIKSFRDGVVYRIKR